MCELVCERVLCWTIILSWLMDFLLLCWINFRVICEGNSNLNRLAVSQIVFWSESAWIPSDIFTLTFPAVWSWDCLKHNITPPSLWSETVHSQWLWSILDRLGIERLCDVRVYFVPVLRQTLGWITLYPFNPGWDSKMLYLCLPFCYWCFSLINYL